MNTPVIGTGSGTTTKGYSLMSRTRDRTDNREETDTGLACVHTVRRTVAGETAEPDFHLVPYGIAACIGSGPEIINAPRFNWVL